MSNNTTSAFLGSPPNTLQDYYIVRGLFRSNGLGDLDPNAGAFFFPPKPPNYVHESKATVVCIGLIVIILSILITTVPRVFLRASKSGMVFGSDDWTIIVAAVSNSSSWSGVLSLTFEIDDEQLLETDRFHPSVSPSCMPSCTSWSSSKGAAASTHGRSHMLNIAYSESGRPSVSRHTTSLLASSRFPSHYFFAESHTRPQSPGGSSATFPGLARRLPPLGSPLHYPSLQPDRSGY